MVISLIHPAKELPQQWRHVPYDELLHPLQIALSIRKSPFSSKGCQSHFVNRYVLANSEKFGPGKSDPAVGFGKALLASGQQIGASDDENFVAGRQA